MSSLADPAYEHVDLGKGMHRSLCFIVSECGVARGYEYKDDSGQVYGPFPAIAIFTWSLKGVFSPSNTLRRHGRLEFHPFSEYEKDILIVARIQLTNLLMDRKEWFYVDDSQNVQGPFSAADMITYVSTRYMKESVKFYGRPVSQEDLPAPPPDAPGFRTYGELLNEVLAAYRLRIQQWREKTYGSQPTINGTSVQPVENGLEHEEEAAVVHVPQAMPLPLLSPVPPQPSSADGLLTPFPVPVPELTFEQMRDRYADRLMSEPARDWYLLMDGQIRGPCTDMKPLISRLESTVLLCSVPTGSAVPSDRHLYVSFEERLKRLHRPA